MRFGLSGNSVACRGTADGRALIPAFADGSTMHVVG
jgi:hypothetical protein